jgi:hypothetical protein
MRWPGLEPGSGHVGFVAVKAALDQVFPRGLSSCTTRDWYNRSVAVSVLVDSVLEHFSLCYLLETGFARWGLLRLV